MADATTQQTPAGLPPEVAAQLAAIRANINKPAATSPALAKPEATAAPAAPTPAPATAPTAPAPAASAAPSTPAPAKKPLSEEEITADKKYIKDMLDRMQGRINDSSLTAQEKLTQTNNLTTRAKALDKLPPEYAHKYAEAHRYMMKETGEREAAFKESTKDKTLTPEQQKVFNGRRATLDDMHEERIVKLARASQFINNLNNIAESAIKAEEPVDKDGTKLNRELTDAFEKDKIRRLAEIADQRKYAMTLTDEQLLSKVYPELERADKFRAESIQFLDAHIKALDKGEFLDKDGNKIAAPDEATRKALTEGKASAEDQKKFEAYTTAYKQIEDKKNDILNLNDADLTALERSARRGSDKEDQSEFWKKIASVAGFIDPKLQALLELLQPMLEKMTRGGQQDNELAQGAASATGTYGTLTPNAGSPATEKPNQHALTGGKLGEGAAPAASAASSDLTHGADGKPVRLSGETEPKSQYALSGSLTHAVAGLKANGVTTATATPVAPKQEESFAASVEQAWNGLKGLFTGSAAAPAAPLNGQAPAEPAAQVASR